ncbi:MAG TPA: TRAP transporter permease [Casimicrobiaceae bacterium]|nr:TRAP transporter permease [Casimicrobiaceae bacterium]
MQSIEIAKTRELEQKFDPEMRFRPIRSSAALLVTALLIVLSCFHYYTAGFGLLRETTHRGVHLAFVLGLIFLVFPLRKRMLEHPPKPGLATPGGVPLYDWMFAVAIALSVLYIPYIYDDLAFRVGNPNSLDVAMGTVLVVLLLEATRRSMGWPLPVIALLFMAYALGGAYFPGLLRHSGASWPSLINHLYLTSQGIYGIAVGVVATYVFHFVLFGVLATAIGLGQLFIDIASAIAGRYVGGPAKVSVFASAMFGMLSGSSVANAVTVGSLTIPAMIRLGYPRHFAGGVEAASSTGGQITPPIMGAAAFLMIEFLNLPYSTIIIAAIVPAFMHFFGVFMQVHFEAKNKGLRGLTREELPDLPKTLRANWPTLIPLLLLIGIIVQGNTPYLAAFTGISSCILVGLFTSRTNTTRLQYVALVASHAILVALITRQFGGYGVWVFVAMVVAAPFLHRAIGRESRIGGRAILVAFEIGAKYALAVGAAAATVGIVIGVVTLTGVGFKLSYIVTSAAQTLASGVLAVLPNGWADMKTLTLIAALIMTGLVCILMGCGVPTTANYIIMVTVAAPTLGLLGVQPLVAHFFVFYYGVLADITPPVALAAYAAAGMAGSDPFKTGNTAFRLGLGKALVPFVFVFAPSLLIMVSGFSWTEFAVAFVGCVLGITFLSASLSNYFLTRMRMWERLVCGFAAILMIAPGIISTAIGIALVMPVISRQIAAARRVRANA